MWPCVRCTIYEGTLLNKNRCLNPTFVYCYNFTEVYSIVWMKIQNIKLVQCQYFQFKICLLKTKYSNFLKFFFQEQYIKKCLCLFPFCYRIFTSWTTNGTVQNLNILGFGWRIASILVTIFSLQILVRSARWRRFSKWASSSVFSAFPIFSSVY